MERTILFMVKDEEFLLTHSQPFKDAGYCVLPATTVAQAEAGFKERHVHLAILDDRMEDDRSATDISGLVFAAQDTYRPVPQIRLTEDRELQDRYPPSASVVYLGKPVWPQVLFETARRAIEQYWPNQQLVIHPAAPNVLVHIAAALVPLNEHTNLLFRIAEVEDLLRKLFDEAVQLTLGRFFTYETGRVVVEVFVYHPDRTQDQVILACGQRAQIKDEDERYARYAPHGYGTGSTVKENSIETLHIAATVYTLAGADLEAVVSFRDFYHRRSTEDVLAALDSLYTHMSRTWYRTGCIRSPGSEEWELYLKACQLDQAALLQQELVDRVQSLCDQARAVSLADVVYASNKLIFYLPDGTTIDFPDWQDAFDMQPLTFTAQIMTGNTHGHITADSVLVDDQGRTWLINFTATDRGSLLREFVLLEVDIKQDLIGSMDMYARYKFEQRLINVPELQVAEEIPCEDLAIEFQVAMRAIVKLRHLAATISACDLQTYLAANTVSAIQRVLVHDPRRRYSATELAPQLHSLLLVMLLHANRTATEHRPVPPPEARNRRLCFDNDGRLWVEEQLIVTLSRREYNVLKYLYEKAGKFCPPEDIISIALKRTDKLEDTSLINYVSRIRRKIKAVVPGHRVTIQNSQAWGYKLELE